MPIISMSIDEQTLAGLDRLQKSLAFAGRSEAIRAGIKKLISENKEVSELSGKINSVLLLVHSESAERQVTDMKHLFDDITVTQIHGNLKTGKCLELFVLDGDASRVKEMLRKAQAIKGVEYFRLVVP